MAIKVAFVSLGCPKNQIDTEIMLAHLLSEGFELVPEDINADAVIINTCGFIQGAKEDAIENILDVAWLKENRSLKAIIVTGCLVERYKEEILSELPEVDAIVGCGSIHEICDAVRAALEKKGYVDIKPVNELKLGGDRVVTTPSYTAYLKIAEGCSNCCSYCAIPAIRGKYRSRAMEDIVAEAKVLTDLGAKEIIVVAQDTTRYGIDLYGEYKLPELLEKLCENKDIKWIRLLYCYPELISDELVKVMAENEQIVNYIDMPIQHINDDILSKMNRRGGSEAIITAVKKLRSAMPDIVIRSTVICGFPTETRAQFNELCEFLAKTKFERLGAFAYSAEEGTKAASMDGQLSEKEKTRRADIIMDKQQQIVEEYNTSRVDTVIDVLCEGYDNANKIYFGRSAADAPDIDAKVYFKSKTRRISDGEIIKVKITDTLDLDLLGETV